MTGWEDRLELARAHLTGAKERMKHWIDQERRDVQLNIGDQVFIRLGRNQFTPPTGMSPSLVRRFEGPFKILEKVKEVTYKLELPFHLRSHYPVFHISQLKPCRMDVRTRREPSPPVVQR
jgi:hypothetical protein